MGGTFGVGTFGVELRGGLGVVPDKPKAVTLWLTAGSSVGSGDLLGQPAARVLLSLSYSPRRAAEEESAEEEEEEPAEEEEAEEEELTMEELSPT